MSASPTTSAATPDGIQDVEPTVVKDGMSYAPAFISRAGGRVQHRGGTVVAARVDLAPVDRCDPSCRRRIAPAPRATTLPAAQQLPRAVVHGPRNGPTMSTFQIVVIVVSLALFGVGVHDLQLWLERWDHERHFND